MTRTTGKRIYGRPVHLVESRYETNQNLGFHFLCVLRVRGMGSAASGHVHQQLERVSPAQYEALEPV
jgi:hypothetical protein